MFERGDGSVGRTSLYCDDEKRLQKIEEVLRGHDVAGVLEAWCKSGRERLRQDLRNDFPYVVESPSGPGLRATVTTLFSRFPRVADVLLSGEGGIVSKMTEAHCTISDEGERSILGRILLGAKEYIGEDRLARALREILHQVNLPQIDYGAGLLFFSKHPILYSAFIPFPDPLLAEWEIFTKKGVLYVVVEFPWGPVEFYLSHHQDGPSKEAVTANAKQVRMAANLMKEAKHPVVYMADFNRRNGTEAHQRLRRILKGQRLNEIPLDGPTYVDDGYFANRKHANRPSGEADRSSREWQLDYVFASEGLSVKQASVLRDRFRWDEQGDYLSDHLPVEFVLEYVTPQNENLSWGQWAQRGWSRAVDLVSALAA